jgi:H+/gluconate symporter-like permease
VTPREHSSVQRVVQLLFWAAALFTFVMAVLPHPPQVGNDKLQHMAAFATLGLLGSLAYRRLSALHLLVGLSLFGAFIEVVQAIPALHRDSDPLDWVADTFACAAIVIALRWWWARRR